MKCLHLHFTIYENGIWRRRKLRTRRHFDVAYTAYQQFGNKPIDHVYMGVFINVQLS